MKKYLIRILCVSLILMIALMPTLASAKKTGYYYVKTHDGNGLRLRAEPKTTGEVITKLPYRSYVLVYKFTKNGNWAYVEADDPDRRRGTVKGYVMTEYLVSKDPGPFIKPDEGPSFSDVNSAAKAIKYLPKPYAAYITTKNPANFVHLRWFPSTSANYIEKYLCNTEIEVMAESKTWAQVRIVEDDYVGFILKSCVDAIDE